MTTTYSHLCDMIICMTNIRLWHFTSTRHLPLILAAGLLRLTESNIGSPVRGDHLGPDCVWFLDVPTVEHDHGLTGSVVDKTEVCVEVLVPKVWVRQWIPWADGQNIDPTWRDVMIKIGGGVEAAAHWFVTFRTVKHNHWVNVHNVRTGEIYWKV